MDAEGFHRELESAYSSGDECANTSPVHSPLLPPGNNHGVSSWRRREEKEIDVAIIGNGPSAILLSLLLSGHRPHLPDEHPNPFLNVKLRHANKQQSLLEEDLQYLSEGLEGRSRNPLSLLFDTLFHPNADIGEFHPSSLTWSHDPSKACSHLVLGRDRPGGSWHSMHSSTITLSLSHWLELPQYSFDSWKKEKGKEDEEEEEEGEKQKISFVDKQRASVSDIAEYYSSYVTKQKLEENFQTGFTVTKVEELPQKSPCNFTGVDIWSYCAACAIEDNGICCIEVFSQERQVQNYRWRVVAVSKDRELVVKAKKLVLACGLGQPKQLEISGEDLPYVIHHLSELHRKMPQLSTSARPLVVIGAGISAADAVLAALESKVPVYHVFRQKATAETLFFNKLPQGAYEEYHRVWSLMQGRVLSPLYTPLEQHTVESFSPDGKILLNCATDGQKELEVSAAVVLVGSHANLDFLPPYLQTSLGGQSGRPIDSKYNPVDVNLYTSQSEKCSDLYALGPLVGDNFVRFVFGSALGAAQSILGLAPQ